MKKAIVSLLVVAFGGVALAVSAEDEHDQWQVQTCVDANGKPTTKITNDTKCELHNNKRKACLIRVANPGQVDWDFAACKDHPASMRFFKEGGGEIKCGDTVALQLGLGGENHTRWYRKCGTPQSVGINICQDEGANPEKKHFDWQIQCSGDFAPNKAFTLRNVSEKDDVVYAKRPSKMVDTCWARKMKLGQCASVRDE